MNFNVAIIGGGPAGSTAGTLLKKYNPSLSVAIFERETFPRDHVGESQLPAISAILNEMGVWDKVEAANFPIKIGSTNRWGKNPELWDFEFIPSEKFVDEPRPARYDGQRRMTAFQVDRAIYDEILLNHARDFGVDVHEGVSVRKVLMKGDRVEGLEVDSGEVVTADYYIDASGHVGTLRKAAKVESTSPSSLKNIALWDYWVNAEWAERIGIGGTKVQVMSLGYGWIWFIPLSPDRTSIGLIVPAEYYKASKLKPEDLYLSAIKEEERISGLTKNATREGKFQTTSDWSFMAGRHAGENWFLAGESGGFADPILAAGMTMAHAAGREVAYTILETLRGKLDRNWLREEYDIRQTKRIRSHIRFADFWYTSNAQFADLKTFTQKLAKDVGLDLEPDKAWQWLATGGFIDENLAFGTGGFTIFAMKSLGPFLSDFPEKSPLYGKNVMRLNLSNATYKEFAQYENGRVRAEQCYVRDEKVLPIAGPLVIVIDLLQRTTDLQTFVEALQSSVSKSAQDEASYHFTFNNAIQALEALVTDGWVTLGVDVTRPGLNMEYRPENVKLKTEQLIPTPLV